MIPVSKGPVNAVIFGNEKFPVLPAPFRYTFHSTLKETETHIRNEPTDVIFIGVSDSDPLLMNNIAAFVKAAPSSVLIALVNDYSEAEVAMSYGASDYMLISRLNTSEAVEKMSIGIARARYIQQNVAGYLYTYDDVSTIAKTLLHDLRNTLSGVMLSLKPIRAAVGNNEDAERYVDILERSSLKMNQIVKHFALATGNVLIKTRDEDFNDMIRYSIANLPANTLKDTKLTQKYSDVPVVLPFDREMIATAIEYLITNAVDAVEGRSNPEIGISTTVSSDSATFTISDNGHGIEHSQLQNIFHPFFTTRTGKAGLGLPIAYSIISAHGGTLRITRSSENGTDVVCRFPLINSANSHWV